MEKLDLGCGPWKKEGYTGIDIRKTWDYPDKPSLVVQADEIYDLNKGIPRKDNSVEAVFCSHFLEHVLDPKELVKEIHRVCVNGSEVIIKVPLFDQRFTNTPLDNVSISTDGSNDILIKQSSVKIICSSVDHVTAFFPNWFERNVKTGFKIKEKKIIYKPLDNGDGILEMTLVLEVLK